MKNIFKRKQKPALVLINPEAWNMIDTYEAIEVYRVKHRSIRRKTKESLVLFVVMCAYIYMQ